MTDLTKVEYRVRKVKRFIVTRFEEGANAAGPWSASTTHGEFDSEVTAFEVGYALASAEHTRLGWPVDDDRMQYPKDDPRYPGLAAA